MTTPTLPRHACGLYVEHNAHRDNYEPIGSYVAGKRDLADDFQSDEHRDRAIATDELWTCQWYPDTPVGCYAVAAPTFDELMSYAVEVQRRADEDRKR